MLLRTLQGTVAEPSGHGWRVTSGFHTTGEESATAPPPPPDVREGKEGQVSYHLSLQSQEGRGTAGD